MSTSAPCPRCGVRFTHPPGTTEPPPGYEPHFAGRGRVRDGGTRGRILQACCRGEGTLLECALLFLPGHLFRARDRLKVLARDLYARPFRRRGSLLDVGSGAGNALTL